MHKLSFKKLQAQDKAQNEDSYMKVYNNCSCFTSNVHHTVMYVTTSWRSKSIVSVQEVMKHELTRIEHTLIKLGEKLLISAMFHKQKDVHFHTCLLLHIYCKSPLATRGCCG